MTGRPHGAEKTGLLGPVALSGGLLLLLAAPLMRGGNRYVALIPLEFIGLVVLLALWGRLAMRPPRADAASLVPRAFLLLVLSPLLLAVAQLVPIPGDVWAALPGHAIYADTLKDVGVAAIGWRPISVSPDATTASLLAGIPISAAMLLGYLGSLSQVRLLLRVVVAVAFAQVLLGLLQIAGGQHSALFVGALSYGPPIGSFANRNHYANFLAMALAAYVWLAYENHRIARAESGQGTFRKGHRVALWMAGGLVLVLGILMSRSRGAALFGLPMAGLGLALVSLRVNGWSRGWKFAATVLGLLLLAAAALVGFESATARFSPEQLTSSAGFRASLARTSFEGAMAFWPWGSGWGTYDLAYPRFQPSTIAGYANHAHMDYVEMLFEGGIFFVVPALAFVWLAAGRAAELVRAAWRGAAFNRESMAAALCGLGLLGLLLHSMVEFNMRIPANAILGALLAGIYLRPRHGNGATS
jgi:hypothetical protein